MFAMPAYGLKQLLEECIFGKLSTLIIISLCIKDVLDVHEGNIYHPINVIAVVYGFSQHGYD